MYEFKSVGRIKYDPHRPGIRPIDQKGRTNRDKWWVIAEVDSEICRYFRWFVMNHLNPLKFENRKTSIKFGFNYVDHPSWGAHCSIIRGEEPRTDELKKLWGKYEGHPFEFYYSNEVIQEGNYFFVLVYSEFINKIRTELELPIKWRPHITIGRLNQS